jgi:phage-related protein
MPSLKPLKFIGDARRRFDAFSAHAKQQAGYQLYRVQTGRQPADFKPMPSIGPGVEELRVWDSENRTYRVIYTARLTDAVYVLHAFRKTSQRTEQRDIELARRRMKQLPSGGRP